jgi:hypothetical protein
MKYFKQIKLASSLLLGAAIVAMPLATTSCNQDSSIKVPIHTFFENDSGATFHISVHNMFDEPFLALESLQGGKEECVEQILSLIPGVLFFPDLQKFHNDPLAMLETSM